MKSETPQEEIKALADYVQGFADANQNGRLAAAANWLKEASENVCDGGYFGCPNRPCTSDHG